MAKEPFSAHLTSIWIGGFFYWMTKGFKGKFSEQIAKQYFNRNFWTGYFISAIGLIVILYLLFK